MPTNSKSEEKAYLKELMEDFPVGDAGTVDDCLQLIYIRHSKFEVESLSTRLSKQDDTQLKQNFLSLPSKLHQTLYKNILSNAGSYRLTTDPEEGKVHFGNNAKHSGVPCAQIESSLERAGAPLSLHDADPIYTGFKFYQQFLMIHPFYDANGRIARFLLSLYLDLHGYYIYWDRVDENREWLKRLSECHKRYNGDPQNYEIYVQRLVAHFIQFVIAKDEIDVE